jgi:uncharacterized membrane protein
MIKNISKKKQFAQMLALGGYFTLMLILIINIIWLIPSRQFPTAMVLLTLVGPLLFPLKGLLDARAYTYQWASFISLAYVAHGITEMAAYPELRLAGFMETITSVLMYIGCILYAGYFKKEKKTQEKITEQ